MGDPAETLAPNAAAALGARVLRQLGQQGIPVESINAETTAEVLGLVAWRGSASLDRLSISRGFVLTLRGVDATVRARACGVAEALAVEFPALPGPNDSRVLLEPVGACWARAAPPVDDLALFPEGRYLAALSRADLDRLDKPWGQVTCSWVSLSPSLRFSAATSAS